jgi:hypothetical protein
MTDNTDDCVFLLEKQSVYCPVELELYRERMERAAREKYPDCVVTLRGRVLVTKFKRQEAVAEERDNA